ncbi:MAG: hypothetical protein HDS68_08395 [Bacteroidales bacterium]|nr:hypothetical protein [Bacteroidales bacterium]
MEHISEERSAEGKFTVNSVGGNPSAMFYARTYSISDFSIRGEFLNRDEAYMVQTGTGHSYGNIEANSYMRLTSNTVVWGTAQFESGTVRDIRWNNSTDFDLVGPYVLADSVGGDMTSRKYSFSGGYAGESNGWTWGAYISYLASIDYRNRDPRDKIVVSDLAVKVGGTRRLFATYALGIGADLRVYNQESDITFYNPNNEIRTYALLGLGYYNPRFSGNTNNSTAYSAFGIGAELNLFDTSRRGGYICMTFHYLPVKQILRNFNNLELTRSGNYFAGVSMGYKIGINDITCTPQIIIKTRRQLGYENLYGSAVGNHYPQIGRRRNYYHDRASAIFDIPLSLPIKKRGRLEFVPGISMSYDRENYRKPYRNTCVTLCSPQLSTAAEWRSSTSLLLSIRLFGRHDFVTNKTASLQGLSEKYLIGTSVLHNFTMLSSAATQYGGRLEADLVITPTIALYLGADCNNTYYPGHGNAIALGLSAGLKF